MSYSRKVLERLTELHPKIIDLSLNRVLDLLDKLGNPHLSIPPAIHIAGTNGKGSTLAFIKAGLEANHQIVHSYTSPHLVDFSERICIRGEKISDSLLIKYLETCELANKNNNITFFEITTCAAFMAFKEHTADYTLLEVGLGGRLDATNVIEAPILTIITPISLDHQQFLGNSTIEIAAEKAGILKYGIPAIVGKQSDEVQKKLYTIANRSNIPISIFGRDWFAREYKGMMIYEDKDGSIELPAPKLIGSHQFENAGIAISALKLLGTENTVFPKSLQNVNWPARLQKLKSGPLVNQQKNLPFKVDLWIDGGHNLAAANAIASFLNQPFQGNTHVILGMIKSKDSHSFISKISPFLESIACVTIPNEPASLSKDSILEEAKIFHPFAFKAESVSGALDTIKSKNFKKDNLRVLICGSLYLCGHLLKSHK